MKKIIQAAGKKKIDRVSTCQSNLADMERRLGEIDHHSRRMESKDRKELAKNLVRLMHKMDWIAHGLEKQEG